MDAVDGRLQVWDVVSELVLLNTHPAPANPLQLDRTAIASLPPAERTMHCAALASFLRDVLMSGNSAVLDDLQFVVCHRALVGHPLLIPVVLLFGVGGGAWGGAGFRRSLMARAAARVYAYVRMVVSSRWISIIVAFHSH